MPRGLACLAFRRPYEYLPQLYLAVASGRHSGTAAVPPPGTRLLAFLCWPQHNTPPILSGTLPPPRLRRPEASKHTNMGHLKSCWSPCFWFGNVYEGSVAVAIYSLAMSICIITYTAYVMAGGDSSQLWLPFFETSLHYGSTTGVGVFVIIYFLLVMAFSVLLLVGIRSHIRGLMLPWLWAMGIICSFQAMFGLWLVFGYYIYLEMVFAALCDGLWMGVHVYCMMVVRSHYDNLLLMQSPDIQYLNTF